MKTVVFAYHNMGICGLKALERNGFEIDAVFTHDDDPGENCWFGSVKDWAHEKEIRVITNERISEPIWVDTIALMKPQVIFSFYYRKMIPQSILDIPPNGAFNLHGSLLPAYRGRCPANWVLVFGEKQTGVTLHYMVEKPDAGDIVGQKAVAIDFTDTAKTLYDKLCNASELLLDETLPLIRSGRTPRRRQNLSSGSYYGGRRPEDGRISWSLSADAVYNLVRAVTDPYPGAYALFDDDEKIIIWWALPLKEKTDKTPGSVTLSGQDVLVHTGKHAIKLLDVEINGRRFRGPAIIEYFKTRKVTRLK
ncbi:MAG: formyltransferase [Smithellaceae bacterium]